MKKNRILVLGNFGFANHDLSGQTIKTRYTLDLIKKYHKGVVEYFDTQTLNNKRNIIELYRKLIQCNRLIYLPAHSNLKYLFPVIFILSKLYNFDIIYSVIGGWLVPYLKNKPIHRYLLKRIRCILAETTRMKKDLKDEFDFNNVSVLYNFRMTDFIPQINNHNELRLVFMARIDKLKGLDSIFSFCDYISKKDKLPNITLDFYGPFSPNVIPKEFLAQVQKYSFVEYKGVLEPSEILSSISNYDLLLLPTHYYTEGLPGTIIESYLAGVPVIVSDWMHAREFVDNGICGFIIPFENHQSQLNEKIMTLYSNRELLMKLKEGAIVKSQQFKEESAWHILENYIK